MGSDKKRSKTKDRAGLRDRLLGTRVRHRRCFLGLTQQKLAVMVGITFQQLQKYETGFNKISASRLIDFSEALGVPVDYFYDGIKAFKDAKPLSPDETPTTDLALASDPLLRRESATLLKNYYRIGDEKLRQSVKEMIRNMAGHER